MYIKKKKKKRRAIIKKFEKDYLIKIIYFGAKGVFQVVRARVKKSKNTKNPINIGIIISKTLNDDKIGECIQANFVPFVIFNQVNLN